MTESWGRLATRRIEGEVHRLVPSRFPPVSLFDSARSEEELLLLAELEGLTNERLREQLGEIHRVAKDDAIYGPGTTPIMAAFCHPAPSRFTDGSYGIYSAALDVETAIAETRHHRERFLRAAGIAHEVLEMRCYTTTLREPMTQLPKAQAAALLSPDDYSGSQAFGRHLRDSRAWGVYYASVRNPPKGRCVGVLRPCALNPVQQTSHYRYFWNGSAIDQIERYERMRIG